MSPDPETELIRYRDHSDEPAFAAFVTRRTDLVWSVALRKLEGDRTLAEEVVQTVFADVVRQIRRLDLNQPLTGWLVKHTLLKAAEAARGERRRKQREHRYSEMNAHEEEIPALSAERAAEAAAMVDALLQILPAADRQALLLRFYEKKELTDVAVKMGSSPEAVRKRIGRVLDLVRGKLARRGITSSATLLSGALLTGSVQAAPAGLAAKATALGLVNGVAPLGFGFAVKLALHRALRESRWLPALAGGAVVAVSVPLWHQPAATAKSAIASGVGEPVSPGAAPARDATALSQEGVARRLPGHRNAGTRPAPESVFADLSRLLESPLGTMATDQARRDFVGRWRDILGLNEDEARSLDAWLADAFSEALTAARKVLNDPDIVRLALDQASGKTLTIAQTAQLTTAFEPLTRLPKRTPWADDLDPERMGVLKARQRQMRSTAAEAAASKTMAELDRVVSLRDDQKDAVVQYEQALAASRGDLLNEEQIGFLSPPQDLPAAPAENEESFLERVLDASQLEVRAKDKTREQQDLMQSLESLRRAR